MKSETVPLTLPGPYRINRMSPEVLKRLEEQPMQPAREE